MRKMFAAILFVAGAVVPVTGYSADFPFVRSELKVDLAKKGGIDSLESAFHKAAESRLVFLDWHIANFTKVPMFQFEFKKKKSEHDDVYASRICDLLPKLKKHNFKFGGSPVLEHFNLTVDFDFNNVDDPFRRLGCEYFSSQPGYNALRIRGFYYVDDEFIATLSSFTFKSLKVEPALIARPVIQ